MNAKEEYWQQNLLHAVVLKRGRLFNVFHNKHEKQARVMETGAYWATGRRDFRKWVKEHGGKCLKPLKTGEYYDIYGQKKALWGINTDNQKPGNP